MYYNVQFKLRQIYLTFLQDGDMINIKITTIILDL